MVGKYSPSNERKAGNLRFLFVFSNLIYGASILALCMLDFQKVIIITFAITVNVDLFALSFILWW